MNLCMNGEQNRKPRSFNLTGRDELKEDLISFAMADLIL